MKSVRIWSYSGPYFLAYELSLHFSAIERNSLNKKLGNIFSGMLFVGMLFSGMLFSGMLFVAAVNFLKQILFLSKPKETNNALIIYEISTKEEQLEDGLNWETKTKNSK